MEIERKFLVSHIPFDLSSFPVSEICQGYLCTSPALRIRRRGDSYILTVKSGGHMSREEYEFPLTADTYNHLLTKIDGNLIQKKRYLIPLNNGLTAELDIFLGELSPLCLVEVEFESEEDALAFVPPPWFGKDVTWNPRYKNSFLSRLPAVP